MNLCLLQLGDSALPIGGYSHSWGLEAAIHDGLVHDAASLESWTRDWLQFALGPFEAVVVAATCRAVSRQDWPTISRANELVGLSLVPTTLRNASRDMGEQLLNLSGAWPWATKGAASLRRVGDVSPPETASLAGDEGYQGADAHRSPGARLPGVHLQEREWHHAVVFATLAAVAGSEPAEAVAVYLHQAALGVIGAGVRGIPIGHSHGQEILARLQELIGSRATELSNRDLDTAGSYSPAYEVMCHAQGNLYTRIFRS